jgi:hypothetical protein
MSEGLPPNEQEQIRNKLTTLAAELSAKTEGFTFSGIENDLFAKIKVEQEEFPGYSTPIDELIKRFTSEGIKVVLGNHPEIENDSIFPRQLQISESTDEKIKELILQDRMLKR